ncbi:MAG: T9SS type A sorting domain-containing protein [Saprospiraceae bacterium]|nr:T9SS type A sorting domain-containing protein [Saprospiraceae bacterium]
MNKVNTLCATALLFLSMSASAQVKFKLGYDFETEYYTVSVISETSLVYPNNITNAGQVTIKVPANNFDPVDIVNHVVGMKWEANSRNNAPSEAPEFDYISFGQNLPGITTPEYVAGDEMELFSFKNAYGCNTSNGVSTAVYLVDNNTDPFMYPNSQSANIGNALSILGANGIDFGGIEGSPVVNCDPNAVLETKEEIGITKYSIFPNPASEFVNVRIDWATDAADANILVMDATGKQVAVSPVNLNNGQNTQKIRVENLPMGTYWVYLAGDDWKVGLDRFTKQ